jgi:hypothetical protein
MKIVSPESHDARSLPLPRFIGKGSFCAKKSQKELLAALPTMAVGCWRYYAANHQLYVAYHIDRKLMNSCNE